MALESFKYDLVKENGIHRNTKTGCLDRWRRVWTKLKLSRLRWVWESCWLVNRF